MPGSIRFPFSAVTVVVRCVFHICGPSGTMASSPHTTHDKYYLSTILATLSPTLASALLSQEICVLPTSLFGAVRKLSFSPDGSSLCGVGADRDSSLCVWKSASGRWTDGARVVLGKGPRRAALFVAWTGGDDCSPYQVRSVASAKVIL